MLTNILGNEHPCYRPHPTLDQSVAFPFILTVHLTLDQLAKPTFRSRYAHTPFTEQSEGPMDTVSSNLTLSYIAIRDLYIFPIYAAISQLLEKYMSVNTIVR